MKSKTIYYVLFYALCLLPFDLTAQEDPVTELMMRFQNYYLNNDRDIVDRTIATINKNAMVYDQFAPVFEAFFGALIIVDPKVKIQLDTKLSTIKKPDFNTLFSKIIKSNIDFEYSKISISPSFNDMNWASFFATGDIKYLNTIIDNLKYIDNRQSIDLYTAAATAKWSLCANLHYEKVKAHLESMRKKNVVIEDLLIKTPDELKHEMNVVINQKVTEGSW